MILRNVSMVKFKTLLVVLLYYPFFYVKQIWTLFLYSWNHFFQVCLLMFCFWSCICFTKLVALLFSLFGKSVVSVTYKFLELLTICPSPQSCKMYFTPCSYFFHTQFNMKILNNNTHVMIVIIDAMNLLVATSRITSLTTNSYVNNFKNMH